MSARKPNRDPICDDLDFLAYCDGRLAGARQAETEARLFASPGAARAAAKDTAIIASIREGLRPALDEPAPPQLIAALESPPRAAAPYWPAAAGLAGAFLLGWLAAGVGVERGAVAPAAQPTQTAALGGVDAGPSSEIVAALDAASADPSLTPAPIDSGESAHATAVPAPDISRFGLAPISARDLLSKGEPVRRVLYAGPNGEHVELLSSPLPPISARAVRLERIPEGLAAYWSDDIAAYRLAADLPEDTLLAIAATMRAAPPHAAPTAPAAEIVTVTNEEAPAGPLAPVTGEPVAVQNN